MRKRYISAALWWGLTLGWVALCLFLSWQTGEQTGTVSMSIARILMKILNVFGISVEAGSFHMFLRKFSHFGVFFVNGILFWKGTEALWQFLKKRKWQRPLSALLLTLAALFTEVPKQWIPGRHLTWSEAFLNAAGALSGYLLSWAVAALVKGLRQRRRGAGNA